jgi:hypothetical protein
MNVAVYFRYLWLILTWQNIYETHKTHGETNKKTDMKAHLKDDEVHDSFLQLTGLKHSKGLRKERYRLDLFERI